jgi:hypothetical protein
MPVMINPTSQRIAALAFLMILASGCMSAPEPGPPRVAGQAVPSEAIAINFGQRFDIHTRLGDQDTDFKNCKIVGFVEGEETVGDGSWGSSSKFYAFSRGWLVIEKPDGRRAYVPASSVVYFEDAAP